MTGNDALTVANVLSKFPQITSGEAVNRAVAGVSKDR